MKLATDYMHSCNAMAIVNPAKPPCVFIYLFFNILIGFVSSYLTKKLTVYNV